MNLETSSPRRDFLRATALAGGGLVIGFLVPGARRFAMAQEATGAAPTTFVPNAFLSIAADDTITVRRPSMREACAAKFPSAPAYVNRPLPPLSICR